jgi:hypothetical protein
MKKILPVVLAVVLSLSAASSFAAGKGKGGPAACKGMKGTERAECIKQERAKKAEAKKAEAPAKSEPTK